MPVIAIRPANSFIIPSFPTGSVVSEVGWNRLQDTMNNLHSVGYTACTMSSGSGLALGYSSGLRASLIGRVTASAPFMLIPGYSRFSLRGSFIFAQTAAFEAEVAIVRANTRYVIYSQQAGGSSGSSSLVPRPDIDGLLPFVSIPGGIEQAYLELSIEPKQFVGQNLPQPTPTIGWAYAKLALYKSDAC